MLEAATAISAILMPVLLIFVIFFFVTKMEKTKFDAVVDKRSKVIRSNFA